MVRDAVRSEPVSARSYPVIRELTGKIILLCTETGRSEQFRLYVVGKFHSFIVTY
jgi:hypothetical protein